MKMDWLRTSLIAGIALLSFLLIIRWNEFQERNQPLAPQTTISQTKANTTDIPLATDIPQINVTDPQSTPDEIAPPVITTSNKLVSVTTDVLQVLIDPRGGDLVEVALPSYFAKINQPEQPFPLLTQNEQHTYIARSGLVGPNGTDTNETRPLFSVTQQTYRLDDGQDQIQVDLVYQQTSEISITKRFAFTRGSHLIDVRYIVANKTARRTGKV
jgi:YidC/Oxa1 family membrane protein insertase